MNKKGVCASYADTFVYMHRKAGLDALMVSRTANGDPKADHAWNAAKLNGNIHRNIIANSFYLN